jgi:hypothetical protein
LPAHLKSQLLDASASVGQNLAEGYGRFATRDKRRFYRIAHGSLRECQMIFAQGRVKDAEALDIADHLGGGLYKLARLDMMGSARCDRLRRMITRRAG